MNPHERLKTFGAQALSDTELLAILRRQTEIRDPASEARPLSEQARNDPALSAALEFAKRVLAEHIGSGDCLNSPANVRAYLRLHLLDREREVFVVLLLNAQHRVIAVEELFSGTLTQTSVYPREVVKTALRHNATAVIFAHNHPSGNAEASHADEMLTRSLKAALELIDVQVLDHYIVAGRTSMSFAERGLL